LYVLIHHGSTTKVGKMEIRFKIITVFRIFDVGEK